MEWNKVTYDNKTSLVTGLPDGEGEYIFSFKNGSVEICELCYDCDGWFLDRGEDLSNVTAWMPVPVPYKDEVDMLENIDGYVSKDNIYRLLSNYRMTHVLTDNEQELLVKIATAIKDMPNEKE